LLFVHSMSHPDFFAGLEDTIKRKLSLIDSDEFKKQSLVYQNEVLDKLAELQAHLAELKQSDRPLCNSIYKYSSYKSPSSSDSSSSSPSSLTSSIDSSSDSNDSELSSSDVEYHTLSTYILSACT
jgi:hypothetical protein